MQDDLFLPIRGWLVRFDREAVSSDPAWCRFCHVAPTVLYVGFFGAYAA